MPAFKKTSRAALALLMAAAGWSAVPAAAQAPAQPLAAGSGAAPQEEEGGRSALDAALFYQLLVGEMELRAGNAGSAFEILLDGARKTGDERLYRRATEVALQSRAGDQALAAAQAWRTAHPESADAHRYVVQLLVALNRVPETLEPLRALLQLTPAAERPLALLLVPRYYSRAIDRAGAAAVIEKVVQPYVGSPATRTAALVAIGRGWQQAQDSQRALALAERAHRDDPSAEGPALLAMELIAEQPGAEVIVKGFLDKAATAHVMRLAYARALVSARRYPDAVAQLEQVTQAEPSMAAPWLSLGALRLELKRPREAQQALERYLALSQEQPAAPAVQIVQGEEMPGEGLTQAYLLLAQAAEEQRDFDAAQRWLDRIEGGAGSLSVQLRRASVLGQQGRVREARELLRALPGTTPDEIRSKLLAEAHLMRELRNWGESYRVLAQALAQFPKDVDLMYEQAMMAEKLGRFDEMERLLRQVIAQQPEHHHAYNALGYTLADRNIRLQEARALIVRALELAPNEPFILDSLGWVEYRLGRREEALALLQRAYQAQPDAEIAAHLGEVMWSLGRRDEAISVFREGRSRDAVNDVLKSTLARLKVDL
ncbi:tetratricopeptide repeat protein [Caldimonas tepidiphila]|uniref:tetratricopeptide repeat protein n=1 Tax=Caldimonas tepidiphila TaxID=2315841 RepID=UPI000E5AB8C8|nr:tetratricopeptide repeat protein [Caldimonas tepidiphila]